MSQSKILTFNADEVRKQLILAIFDQNGGPDIRNINGSVIEPALWLVKDHAGYLMVNSRPEYLSHKDVPAPAFARETDSRQYGDRHAHINSEILLGKENLCIPLSAQALLRAVRRNKAFIQVEILEKKPSTARQFVAAIARFLGVSNVALSIVSPTC